MQFPRCQPTGPWVRCSESVQSLGAKEQAGPGLPGALFPQTHPQFHMVNEGPSLSSRILRMLTVCIVQLLDPFSGG